MLRSLDVLGFKSFADRTTFEFAEGITCVVGPNGSGKSNVVDAIKWILGDQSAKSLRGKEMADVIFNGASGRKPGSMAEATLTFDNSAGLLPVDAAEVQIGRRLYRSGDSEYLLNRQPVRLKDIRELFMGTGAGTAAYSIIEQGRVDQILQANPTSRRVVFEEAAGISRFKARRIEAQRRLERVDQNLVRLRDYVDQLEARLTATRSQASKAARYRELSQELRELWTGLAADDYRAASARLVDLDGHQRSRQARLTQLEASLATLHERLSEADGRSISLEKEVRHVDREKGNGREAIAGLEAALQHQFTQELELSAEIERLRGQRHRLRMIDASVRLELEQSQTQLEQLQQAFHEQRTALEERERTVERMCARLGEARDELLVRRQARDDEMRQRDRAAAELADWQAQHRASQGTLETLRSQRETLETAHQAAADELTARLGELHLAEARLAEAQSGIAQRQRRRRELLRQHDTVERELAEWRERRSALTARRLLLEELERRQEGLTLGVRDILDRAARSEHLPWSLVRGHVGQLLQCELDDAPLLEVALGPRLQLIVLDDLRPMVAYLNSAIAEVAGRIGFLEVRTADSPAAETSHDRNDLTGQPGIMARADTLVTISDVPGLAERLLSDTWIVETLDAALRLAHGQGRGCRFVTLQGELLDVDGTLHVGNVPNESAVISRRSELRQMRQELQQLSGQIDVREQHLSESDAALHAADEDLQEWQSQYAAHTETWAARRSAWETQEVACAHLRAELDAVERELHRVSDEARQTYSAITRQAPAVAERTQALAQLTEELREREALLGQIEQELHQLQQTVHSERLQLAKHEERLLALDAAHDRLRADQAQRRQQLTTADVQLRAREHRLRDVRRSLLQQRARLDELMLSDQQLVRQSRQLHAQLDQARGERRQVQWEQDRLREERRSLTDLVHQTDIRIRDLNHQQASLAERIRDEFQLELAELVEQGVSLLGDPHLAAGDESPPVPATQVELADSGGELDHESLPVAEDWTPEDDDRRREIEDRIERLRRKIKALGAINPDSLKDLDEIESQYAERAGQLEDLEQARTALEEIIRRLDAESRKLFMTSFEAIRGHFRALFRKLFGGGEGDIILEDPEDVLECGIDLVARPPGKELRSISLLSGGEKTLTAVALLFAMFKSKPSPYCILDEVDAALDEANVDRYVGMVREFRASTQIIIITHRKRTMSAADRLFGVTMEQPGVSKRLTVRFEDVHEDGQFRTASAA